jgi:hypothetical protein
LVAALAALAVLLLAGENAAQRVSRPASGGPFARYADLPLAFEPNRGQAGSGAAFLARGAGYGITLRPTQALISLGTHGSVRVSLAGANGAASLVPERRLPGHVNYLLGSDRSRWLTGIPTYERLTARNVYRGIDIAYHGRRGRLEYDFVVHPGASPEVISLRFSGARRLKLDREGNLVLQLRGGMLREFAPRVYQRMDGRRRDVPGRFVLRGSRVGFAVGPYDPKRTLVIDPPIYSTYLGGAGTNDIAHAVAVDGAGQAYVAGEASAGFPTTPGSKQPGTAGGQDAFVTKLNASGSALVYSTYLGGSNGDFALGIALDSGGNAYVTGRTNSSNFPTTPGSKQPAKSGDDDAFVAKLDPTGSALVYSTYLGGSTASPGLATADDSGRAIAVDTGGNAYVTGQTSSTNFPTAGPYQAANAGRIDAFVSKLDPTGSTLAYSTYLGGSTALGGSVANDVGSGIALDGSGNAYVAGDTYSTNFPTANCLYCSLTGTFNDAFVTKLNASGSALVYSNYLGGTVGDAAEAVAVDGDGNAYVTGRTASSDFKTANPYQPNNAGSVDAFVTKINAAGSVLLYSTYLGGSNTDYGHAIDVDSGGNAYVDGETLSTNFPTQNPVQPTNAGASDAFVTKLSASGTALAYSTYLGGSAPTTSPNDVAHGIAVDGTGDVYAAGETRSTNFPTTVGAYQTTNGGGIDAFVSKLASPVPTAVALRSFSARRARAGVLLRWRTGEAAGLLGFRLYRGQRRLNPVLVPARGQAVGGAYAFLDRTAPRRGPLRYRLEAVDANGMRGSAQVALVPGG